MKEFLNYRDAITFATLNHGINLRKDGKTPYIVHPIRITTILRAVGFSEFEDCDLMIAALFHDLIEDTSITFNEIEKRFGNKVASIVQELTISNKKEKDVYFKELEYASNEAKIIKLADRIDNLLDMSGELWTVEKKKAYAEQANIILNSCGSAHFELASRLKKEIDYILEGS